MHYSIAERLEIEDLCSHGSTQKGAAFRTNAGLLLFCALAFVACANERPSNLDARLSDNGSIVALVRYKSSGTEMRIGRIDRQPIQWTAVDIPSSTQTFNFGIDGDEILITYIKHDSKKSYTVYLEGIPLADAIKRPTIYASSTIFLAFPVQLPDRSILVLSGRYKTESGRVPEKIWQIIRPGGTPQSISEPFVGSGTYPNVVGNGFYAIEPVYKSKAWPILHRWALPGGAMPDVTRFLTPQTSALACTAQGDFCIRRTTSLDQFQFLGELSAISDGKECPIQNLPKRIDRVSIAPHARVAAVVAAKDAYAPRKLQILKFAPNSCEVIKQVQVEE